MARPSQAHCSGPPTRIWRHAAIFSALVLTGTAWFAAHGWISCSFNGFEYRIGRLSHCSTDYSTVAALTLLVAVAATPKRLLGRALAPLALRPGLLPGVVAALGGACFVYRIMPLWSYFAGTCLTVGALCWLTRRETPDPIDRALARCATARAFPWALAILTAVASFVLNRLMYQGEPHVIDSWARYAHILMMSHGHWRYPAPPDWQWTVQHGMINDGVRYCSQYQPGALLIGLAGHFLGSLAALPALLAGGVVLLTWLTGRRLYGAPTAALGAVLLTLSSNFVYLSASFMEHTPTTFFLMLALWLGLRDLERPRAANAWAMGFAVGYACITRSLSTLGWAGPLLGVWAAVRWRRWGRSGLRSWGAALAGWLAPIAFFLYFNHETTGSALVPGYRLADPATHSLGFTAVNRHTPVLGIAYQWNNVWALSFWLFFWPVTSYLFVFAHFVLERWDRRDTAMALPFAGLVACYFFYPYQDFGFSPRFLAEAIPLLCLLTARGIGAATRHLEDACRTHEASPPGVWPRTMLAFLVGLFALAVPAAWPQFIWEYRDQQHGVRALGQTLAPFRQMPNASVFLVRHHYTHRALPEIVECWGGAQFFDDVPQADREAYVRAHPERQCFIVREGRAAEEIRLE